MIAVPLGVACHQAANQSSPVVVVYGQRVARAADVPNDSAADPFEALARRDPLQALYVALDECNRLVTDYTCTFIKQEQVQGKLTKQQQIDVKCRTEPFSVLMDWVVNPDKAKRALYVAGKWKNRRGGEQAYVDPTGWAVDLLLGKKGGILQDIHGAGAKAVARRSIDQFGFANTLRLLIKYSAIAQSRDELQLTYEGRSELTGRPTLVFKRILPYTGDDGEYPDLLALVHLDQETHLPIGVFTWGDVDKQDFLGSYETRDINLNQGFDADAFSKEANGF